MIQINRNTALDAIYVLNDILDSLVAGTMVFHNYQKRYESGTFSQPGIVAVQKMCISHLILGLSKLIEFWKRYNKVVPDDLRDDLKSIVTKLQTRDLQHYRNTVVAHILDNELEGVRTQLDAFEQLNRISNHNPKDFLNWVNNPNSKSASKDLASIVECVRDRLIEEHGVSPKEVFRR